MLLIVADTRVRSEAKRGEEILVNSSSLTVIYKIIDIYNKINFNFYNLKS